MALRRNKFEVGEFVRLKDHNNPAGFGEPVKIIQTFRDDTNDTFCYRLEGSGWVYEISLCKAQEASYGQ